jgi:hypothetical protein
MREPENGEKRRPTTTHKQQKRKKYDFSLPGVYRIVAEES